MGKNSLTRQETDLIEDRPALRWVDAYEGHLLREAMAEAYGSRGNLVEELTRRAIKAANNQDKEEQWVR